MSRTGEKTDFKSGQRVKVVQNGTWRFDGLVLTDNTFVGVTISRKNDDGSYQVKGIIKTPQSDEVTVPAEWIEPL